MKQITTTHNAMHKAWIITSMVALGAALLAWYLLSTDKHPACCEAAIGSDYHILIDQSQSRQDANEQVEWLKSAMSVADNLKGGDTICLISINAHSDQTAKLFQDRMPLMPDDPTLEEEREIRETWKRVRREAHDAIEAALNPANRANWSDLFAALDRVQVIPQRPTQIIILSDMLHSDPELLDLERVRLTEQSIGETVNKAVAKYRWERGRWGPGTVRVFCILNSLDIHAKHPLNERQILKQFWGSLLEYLSNDQHTLATFDTQLPFNQLGGNDVAAK